MPRLFVPLILAANHVSGQDNWRDQREQLLDLIISHPQQKRRHMIVHPILMRVAQFRAYDQAMRQYTGHTDPDGLGPNFHVRSAGYRLPDYYGKDQDDNNVESLQHNATGDIDLDVRLWLESEGHRQHILGLNDFYAAQHNIGVGFFYDEDSPKRCYEVFISAPPEQYSNQFNE